MVSFIFLRFTANYFAILKLCRKFQKIVQKYCFVYFLAILKFCRKYQKIVQKYCFADFFAIYRELFRDSEILLKILENSTEILFSLFFAILKFCRKSYKIVHKYCFAYFSLFTVNYFEILKICLVNLITDTEILFCWLFVIYRELFCVP